MVRLEDCGLFKEVDLNTLKRKKAQSADLKSFTISCIKKPLIDLESNNKLENAKAEK
jgi:hypothetical protein